MSISIANLLTDSKSQYVLLFSTIQELCEEEKFQEFDELLGQITTFNALFSLELLILLLSFSSFFQKDLPNYPFFSYVCKSRYRRDGHSEEKVEAFFSGF